MLNYDLKDFLLINKSYIKNGKYTRIENEVLVNLVIPNSLLIKCFKAIHSSGHDDAYITLFKFRLDYYNPHERSLIQKFICDCEVCKILKVRASSPIKIMSAPIAKRPLVVSIDFVGPLSTTDKDNKYILVIDLFLRFTRLFATSNKSSETVIECLTSVFNTFIFPETLLSDNALEFKFDNMLVFAKLTSIIKKEVLPYSAWSNGIV